MQKLLFELTIDSSQAYDGDPIKSVVNQIKIELTNVKGDILNIKNVLYSNIKEIEVNIHQILDSINNMQSNKKDTSLIFFIFFFLISSTTVSL